LKGIEELTCKPLTGLASLDLSKNLIREACRRALGALARRTTLNLLGNPFGILWE